MNQPSTKIRFQLTLTLIPDDGSRKAACRMIYGSSERDVMAALSSLPFTVGRSFSPEEASQLHRELRLLKVHHHFLSPDSEATEFSYLGEEEAKAREEMTESYNISEIRRLSGVRKHLSLKLLAALVVVGVGIYATISLWPHLRSPTPAPPVVSKPSEGIATLGSLSGDVQIRGSNSAEWLVARPDQALSTDDSVKTGPNGRALIIFRDGSQIQVRGLTLIRIARQKANLAEGSFVTQLSPRAPDQEIFRVESADWNLALRYPQKDPSYVQTSQKSGTFTVEVARGEAELSKVADPSSFVLVTTQQKVAARTDELPKPEPYIPTLTMTQPLQESVLPFGQGLIRFEWEPYPGVEMYQWELAADPNFENSLLKQEISNPFVELSYVDAGKLYWRVSTQWNGLLIQSKVGSFTVEPPNHESSR